MIMLCKDAFEFFRCNLPHLPGNYLEFGVFDGDGLRLLATLYPQKMFYGVDPFIEDGNTWPTSGVGRGDAMPRQKENALRNSGGVSNIRLFVETSKDFCRRYPDEASARALELGCIFIDGSHHYEDVANDCHFSQRAIVPGGVIFFDDLYLPDVARAVEELQVGFSKQIDRSDRIGGACLALRIKP